MQKSTTSVVGLWNNVRNYFLIIFAIILLLTAGFFIGKRYGERRQPVQITTVINENYQLDAWQIYEMATVLTESNFDKFAQGPTNDFGVFQITPIYIKDVNRIQSDFVFQITDAYDIDKSLMMFNYMQNHYNPEHSVDAAMKLHNPGGKSVNYFDKVYKNIAFIKRMEEVRKEVVKNYQYKSNFSAVPDTIYIKSKINYLELNDRK